MYSTYEAKARFSELLRQVRRGKTVTITYRGEPVAELRPIDKAKVSIEERMKELEQRGALTRSRGAQKPFRPLAHRPGALQRFLDERD